MLSICLNMVVKDEASVIRQCLESARRIVDHWVIVDAGSTDGTQEIVREFMASIPGELHERPGGDFGCSRREALSLARDKADYVLILNAGDRLEYQPDFARFDPEHDSYSLRVNGTVNLSHGPQLVSNALPWRYDSVLHEFLICDDARTNGELAGVTIRRNYDLVRRGDQPNHPRDPTVLEKAIRTENRAFVRVAYIFCLAQCCQNRGENEKALENYLKRAELGHWDQEVYVSLCEAARLLQILNRPSTEVLATYNRAIRTCPGRAEAYHGASRYLRYQNKFAEGIEIARPAVDLKPPEGALLVSHWVYDYGLLDEFAVNAYWSGHYEDCLSASRRILALATVPPDARPRIESNAGAAAWKLQEAEAARKTSPEPQRKTYPVSDWAPNSPLGGTELMVEGLRRRLDGELDRVDLRVNWFDPAGLTGKPLILWMHHDIDQAAVQWCRDGSLVARAQVFVFVSYWQMGRFIESFQLPPDRCVVLKNATTIDRPLRTWNPGSVRRLAYVSTPFRGLDVLLDAWDRLRPDNAELHIWSSLKLYGAARDDAPYEALFARATALPNVFYRGIVPNEQLREELRSIDYLAYPSTFAETSCLSVIEAMAAGCRVICPALGALPETAAGFARIYPWQLDREARVAVFADVLAEELDWPWQGRVHLGWEQQVHCQTFYEWGGRTGEWRMLIRRLTVDEHRIGETAPTWRTSYTQDCGEHNDLILTERPTTVEPRDDNETFARFLQEIEENAVDESIATRHWRERCKQIREDARAGNRFDFLRWPSLTDFSVPESYVPSWCYDELRASSEWGKRWFGLTRESKTGNPKDFSRDFGTSPILVQHAYHLHKYESITGESLQRCDVIFEIGGGYGSFCRLLRNSGFAGLHIIYDLPHVSSIQRLYLTLAGFTEVQHSKILQRHTHGFCLVSDSNLDGTFDRLKNSNLRVGLIATWSLSETPMAVRDRIFPRFHQVCQQYLIAFQPAWEEINNVDYFQGVQSSRPDLAWKRADVPPSFYLFA